MTDEIKHSSELLKEHYEMHAHIKEIIEDAKEFKRHINSWRADVQTLIDANIELHEAKSQTDANIRRIDKIWYDLYGNGNKGYASKIQELWENDLMSKEQARKIKIIVVGGFITAIITQAVVMLFALPQIVEMVLKAQ